LSDGEFELVTLRNGHRAVRHKGHGEVMHPSVGPWAEAKALYVDQARFDERARAPMCIFDIGLGAAANAVAALTRWDELGRPNELELHSFEIDLMPLRLALADPAGFPFLTPWARTLHELCERGHVHDGKLRWTLHLGDALQNLHNISARATLVFHDPFSPESNPTMWSVDAFKTLRAVCGDAALFTYSASTRTRVALLLGGFFVGVGDPIGTKQETTVAATSKEALQRPLGPEFLKRWERSSARAPWGGEVSADLEQALRNHPQFR
jgi:tRNA U34 5-methylaminomethyl-2-thiouridine-forming methyltransferase MnmC